jgi:hypothetical protein
MWSQVKALSKATSNPTMLRLMIATLLLWLLWEPIRPIRTVTAEALYTAAEMVRR